jgi:hypothetical protein
MFRPAVPEVCRQPQGIEGLVKGLGGVLRLTAVSYETLLRFQATTLASFGELSGVSFPWGHEALLVSVGGFGHCSLPKRT